MKNWNMSSCISVYSDIDNDQASLISYNINLGLPMIIENNFGNISILNFNNTNDISQGLLTNNEKDFEDYKQIFKPFVLTEENYKNIQALNSFNSIEENKDNNNLEDNNTSNANSSNIFIEIKNTNFNYEDKNENQNIIFNRGDYEIHDIYSKNIIDEALNDSKKKCKKRKKLFRQFPKKKKKKNIEHRKDNADNKRKKIKVKFLRILKDSINEKLKKAGSKYIFNSLPQSFVTNITKNVNKPILDLPLEEIFKRFIGKEKNNKKNNIFVLKYLENHKEISEKSHFNKIKKMKFEDAFKEYLLSKEFKLVIASLKKDEENDKYIKDYIIKAYNFINFIKHDKKEKKNIILYN